MTGFLTGADMNKALVSRPKARPFRSEAYRRAVAGLPCALCGIEGFSQAAHADEGKGLGIKACDLTCYPACADRPGVVGCHTKIGATGTYSKDERRELEQNLAAQTRKKVSL